MPNAWVQHCKDFAKKYKIAYGCAISNEQCRESYHKKRGPSAKEMVAELKGLDPSDAKPLVRELSKALRSGGNPEELLTALLRKRGYDV